LARSPRKGWFNFKENRSAFSDGCSGYFIKRFVVEFNAAQDALTWAPRCDRVGLSRADGTFYVPDSHACSGIERPDGSGQKPLEIGGGIPRPDAEARGHCAGSTAIYRDGKTRPMR